MVLTCSFLSVIHPKVTKSQLLQVMPHKAVSARRRAGHLRRLPAGEARGPAPGLHQAAAALGVRGTYQEVLQDASTTT